MNNGLAVQIRGTFEALDDAQAPLTVEEIIHRAGPVRPLSLEEPQAAGRNWWIPVLVAAGAAVITFLVLIPVLFLNADRDEAPATTPSTVTSTTLESLERLIARLGDRVGGVSMVRATRLPVGVQYVAPGNPSIGLTSVEDFWYAQSISCKWELDFVVLRYFEVPTADVQIGPLRGDVVLRDVAGLYAAAMGGAQVVESVVGEWPALRVEGTLADGLPWMPGTRVDPMIAAGATSLVFYVADTGMGALYVLISAESTDFAAFAERAQPLINSLTIESDAPWGVCN